MKKLVQAALLLLLVVPLSACFRHTFQVGAGAPNGELIYDHWHNHWVFGIIGDDSVNVTAMCPSGDATVHEETTFLNGLVNVLIGVIYSPTTVTVRCDGGRSAALALTPEQVAEILASPGFISAVERLAPDRASEVRTHLKPDH